jgi:hypothetical protein
MRNVILGIFFGLQLVGIGYSRLASTRYFSWAPFDQISFYTIEAEVNGLKLTGEEVMDRYNIPSKGRENRSIDHLFAALRQYEDTYGLPDIVHVKVSYQINGGAQRRWNYINE